MSTPLDMSVATKSPVNRRRIAYAIVTAGAAIFIAANAHLVYVALQSQPDCVPHAKPASGEAGSYSAAKSAC